MKFSKKLISFLLALCLTVLALPVSAAITPFTDVPDNAWFSKAVIYAYENNLFSGEGNGKFNPEGSMTRGMFVQVLANKTENYKKADWVGKSSFSDVNKSLWYAAPVEWASKAGLVQGVGDGKFAPGQNVTREQMAVIMYKYAQITGNDTSFDDKALSQFPDAGSVSKWAKEAMQWAVTHKIINGSDGKLKPKNNAKRCEVAQVMVNAAPILLNNTVEIPETPMPDPAPDPSPKPDPDPTPEPDPNPDPTPTPDPDPTPTPSGQMGLPEKYHVPGIEPDAVFINGEGFIEHIGADGEYPTNENKILKLLVADGFWWDVPPYDFETSVKVNVSDTETRYFFIWGYTNSTTGERAFLARDYSAGDSKKSETRRYCIKMHTPPTVAEIRLLF